MDVVYKMKLETGIFQNDLNSFMILINYDYENEIVPVVESFEGSYEQAVSRLYDLCFDIMMLSYNFERPENMN